MVMSDRADIRSRGDGTSWLDCPSTGGSKISSTSSSSCVLVESLEPTDGGLLLEFSRVEAGFDIESDSLEGLRAGISGVVALHSCMGSKAVCGNGPLPSCHRAGSVCIAAMSSGGSGMRGEYFRSARGGVE